MALSDQRLAELLHPHACNVSDEMHEALRDLRAYRIRWQETQQREKWACRALAAAIEYKARCPADPDATPEFLRASVELEAVLFGDRR